MDGKLAQVAKEGQKGLLMLAELAQHAAIMGEMGELYNERYLHKGDYRETRMFQMSVEIFIALHDLLVSTNGLISTNNV
jgi:hypothetical protein